MAVGLTAVHVAFAPRYGLYPFCAPPPHFHFSLGAVVIASVYEGLLAGLFALTISLPLAHLLLAGAPSGLPCVGLVTYTLIGVGIAALGEFLVRARIRERTFAEEPQNSQTRLQSIRPENLPHTIEQSASP